MLAASIELAGGQLRQPHVIPAIGRSLEIVNRAYANRRAARSSSTASSAAGGRSATIRASPSSVATFLYRDAVISGRVFFQLDVGLMWYTQMTTLVGAVTRGEWPLWNPWIGFGQPLWADANNEILYPFTWLNLLLRPWAYYTLFVVAHSVLAGAG